MDVIVKEIRALDESLLNELKIKFEEERWDFEHTKKFIENPDSYLICAFIDRELVGLLTGFKLQKTNNKNCEFLLYEIDVSEQFRQKGIAKQLVKRFLDIAKLADASEVWVLTNKSNQAAMRLYESTGAILQNPDDAMLVYKL